MKNKFKFTCCLLIISLFILCGCGKQLDLSQYVSEYRSNIYIGTNGDYSAFISFGKKEYPYAADGIAANESDYCEIALTAVNNTRVYKVIIECNDKKYESELSFNNVHMIHKATLTLPDPQAQKINVIAFDAETNNEIVFIVAESVKKENTLSVPQLLKSVYKDNKQTFDKLTQKNQLQGEIHVRLLCNDEKCYYYVGVVDRMGKTRAILADAQSGKTLATHESEQN